jgi:carbon-monoxide dehydrogenase medium subunit
MEEQIFWNMTRGVAVQDFEYVAVHNVSEAVNYLAQSGKRAGILAGGTDILVLLRERRTHLDLLVDIKDVPEVNTLEYDPVQGLRLGAAVPCFRIWNHPEIAKTYPGLIDAVSIIGGIQIQGRASVGGNLCNASPAADTIPSLIVHYATCRIAGPDGYREVPVEEFCKAPRQTVLGRGEFLVSLQLPPPPAGFGAHYLRFTPRNEMDIAVVGCGASVVLDETREQIHSARLALGAVAPTPLYLEEVGEYLAGRPVTDDVVARASDMAREAARPIDDMRGTVAQRRHLSGVLASRALHKAIERAKARK